VRYSSALLSFLCPPLPCPEKLLAQLELAPLASTPTAEPQDKQLLAAVISPLSQPETTAEPRAFGEIPEPQAGIPQASDKICHLLISSAKNSEQQQQVVCDTAAKWNELEHGITLQSGKKLVLINSTENITASNDGKRICRYGKRPGSNMLTKTCHSEEMWAAMDTIQQQRLAELGLQLHEYSQPGSYGPGADPSMMQTQMDISQSKGYSMAPAGG